MLFARTRHLSRILQQQFLEGSVEKTYLVQAQGSHPDDHFYSAVPISAETEAVAQGAPRPLRLPVAFETGLVLDL